ncbi:hypothetical protein PtA15_13A244 [Puccinia triticina]|uniref:Uncharacterized protein n=1 Tax=Puccinia triticina TaxID=208348 RepID=A0ABY7D4B9_9BASI|nr:uncharacterized protein PtA15_13A244 [Puccinia triticina]WAQ90845.1 hypothetical protein PtA15_13A244 [Puccinia triticina]
MNLGMKGLEQLAKVYISCNWILASFQGWQGNNDLLRAPTHLHDSLLMSVEASAGFD